jgi:predicted transcriptional regulator
MKAEIQPATYRLPRSLVAAIDEIAGRRGRSRNAIVTAALEQYAKRNSATGATVPSGANPPKEHPLNGHPNRTPRVKRA